MFDRTPIYIVCSPRPRNGKTFLARLMTDFLRASRLGRIGHAGVEAFDVNPYEPVLAEFIPQVARTIDLGETRDQMALFDCLVRQDAVPKVVDLGHASYARFFDVAEDIGFIRETRRRGIEPIILFPVDSHAASGEAFGALHGRFDGLTMIPVMNDAIATGNLYRDRFHTQEAAAVPFRIPVLPPGLKTYADMPRYSFAAFHETLPIDIPLGLSFELRNWTRRQFLEFREMELRLLLRKLRSSLQQAI